MKTSLLNQLIQIIEENPFPYQKYGDLRDFLTLVNEKEKKSIQHPVDRISSSDKSAYRSRSSVYGDNTTSEPNDELIGVVCWAGKDEEGRYCAYIDVPKHVDIELSHPDYLLPGFPSRDLERYTKFKFYPEPGKEYTPPNRFLIRVKLPRGHHTRDLSTDADKAIYYSHIGKKEAVEADADIAALVNDTADAGEWSETSDAEAKGVSNTSSAKFGKHGWRGRNGDRVANNYRAPEHLKTMLSEIKHFPGGLSFAQQIAATKQNFRDGVANLEDNPKWEECIKEAGRAYNVDPAILRTLASEESGMVFNGGSGPYDRTAGVIQPYGFGVGKEAPDKTFLAKLKASKTGKDITKANWKEPCAQFWMAARLMDIHFNSMVSVGGKAARKLNRNDPDDILIAMAMYGTGGGGFQKYGMSKWDPHDSSTWHSLHEFVSENTKPIFVYQHQRALFQVALIYDMWKKYEGSPVTWKNPPSGGDAGQTPPQPRAGTTPTGKTGKSSSFPTTKPKMVLVNIDVNTSKATSLTSNIGATQIKVREDIAPNVRKIKELLNLYDIPFTCNFIEPNLVNKNLSEMARVGLEINLNINAGLTKDSNYDSDDYYVGPDPKNPTSNKLKIYAQVRKNLPVNFSLTIFSPTTREINIFDIRETYNKTKPKIIKIYKTVLDLTDIFEYYGFHQARPEKEFYSLSDNKKSNWYIFYNPSKITNAYSYKELLNTVYENHNENIWYEKNKYWDEKKQIWVMESQ